MIYITTECSCGELVREGEEHTCPTLNDVMGAAEANGAPDEHELLEPRTEPDNRRPSEPPAALLTEIEVAYGFDENYLRQLKAALARVREAEPGKNPSELIRVKLDAFLSEDEAPDLSHPALAQAAVAVEVMAYVLGEVLDEVLK